MPTTVDAVSAYESNGGRLTRESCFGCDPLHSHQSLQSLRYRDFNARYPDMEIIFQGILHGDPQMFRDAIMYYTELTHSFSSLI